MLAIRKAAKQSYEFIEVCFHKGLCTFEEAKKAQDKVHKDCLSDLEDASHEQFMMDQKLNSQNYL